MTSSGAMSPALAPASIDMLQIVIRPSIERRGDRVAAVLDDRADAAAGADAPDDGEDHVLGGGAVGQLAGDRDGHRAGAHLGERLRGEHVLDLAGADAEGQRPEGAVGGGVAVAADDRHAGQRAALLRADHVDDALVRVAHAVVGDAELGGVGGEDLELLGRDRVLHRLVDVGGGHVVVGGGDGEVGAAHPAPRQPDAVEGLGAGDLVDEVEIDVEQVGLAGCAGARRGGPTPSRRASWPWILLTVLHVETVVSTVWTA